MTNDMISKTLLQFFMDGYDTVGSATTAALYFLACNSEAQAQAYDEVKAMVDASGDLDTSAVSELKYLDAVISETNRLAPFPYTYRTCTKPWKVPGTDVILPVGMRVLLPISGYHMDPDLWESPKEFRPERFSLEVSARRFAAKHSLVSMSKR